MENRDNLLSVLQKLRKDVAKKQKRDGDMTLERRISLVFSM